MAVQQFLLHSVNTEAPMVAVATDGTEVQTVYADAMFGDNENRDSMIEGMDQSFKMKLEKESLQDLPAVERLMVNLYFFISDPVEHTSFDEARTAAQEALGE